MNKKIEIVKIKESNDELGEMVSLFRKELRSFKGIESKVNIQDGKEELDEFLNSDFPIFAASTNSKYVGYLICRIENEIVWVEQIFVKKEYRLNNIATLLCKKAEEISTLYGNETLYFYVHPNNDVMINFLRKQGYSVLNLIEIRKPYKDEKLLQKIKVGDNEFDY